MNAQDLATVASARVMIVDDEESIRLAVSELLASEDIETVTAAGVNECLEFLRGGFKGIILMDVMMPGCNGWDAIRKIQTAGLLEGNLVSMLTAMDVPDERMEGLQEIVIDYISKPFEPAEFVNTIKNYLVLLEQIRGGN